MSGLIGLCALAGRASANDELDDGEAEPIVEVDEVGTETEARSSADVEAVLAEESIAAASGLLDTTSIQNVQARHQRPSRFGRLDLSVAWRVRDRIDDAGADAVIDRNTVVGASRRRGELWLLLTWRN